MPAPSWEDLSEFFDTDDDGGFAVVATLTLADGTTRDVNVIYDEPYSRTDIEGGGGIRSADYHFTAAESDLAGLENECSVTVAGKTLRVLSVEQDGTGMSQVWLTPYQASPYDRRGTRL